MRAVVSSPTCVRSYRVPSQGLEITGCEMRHFHPVRITGWTFRAAGLSEAAVEVPGLLHHPVRREQSQRALSRRRTQPRSEALVVEDAVQGSSELVRIIRLHGQARLLVDAHVRNARCERRVDDWQSGRKRFDLDDTESFTPRCRGKREHTCCPVEGTHLPVRDRAEKCDAVLHTQSLGLVLELRTKRSITNQKKVSSDPTSAHRGGLRNLCNR